jgi:hypothetical protein
MPAGHTDIATINKRRPLTPGMSTMLDALLKGPVAEVDLSQAEDNQMRALCVRKLAAWVLEGRCFVITDPGRREAARKRAAR